MKNTPVTLAHLRLANQLVSSPPSPLVLATLIAESEAKSCGELSCDECNARTAALTAERDQLRAELATCKDASEALVESLRAEVERLRDGGVQRIKDAMAVVMDERDSFKARAERAEADADSTRERALTLANSLDEAQAELAAERDKVKTLRSATDLLMARANDELKSGRPALIAMQWHRIEPIIAALAATEETK